MAHAGQRVAARAVSGLSRRTQPSRERIAVTGFFLGSESPWDRLLSRSFFAMSNLAWAGYEAQDTHHASFREGLSQLHSAPDTVVDLGTGAGGTAALMAQMWPAAQVIGIDSSRRMVRRARKQHPGVRNLSFVAEDGLHLPRPDGSVDLVTSLNYMPFPGEVRRLLRPGGSVMVASTFQAVGSKAVEAQWRQHGFTLEAQQDAEIGSFEIYRRAD